MAVTLPVKGKGKGKEEEEEEEGEGSGASDDEGVADSPVRKDKVANVGTNDAVAAGGGA